MEHYIKTNVSDITYKSELIPTNMPKLSKRILAYLMSRDRNDERKPLA